MHKSKTTTLGMLSTFMMNMHKILLALDLHPTIMGTCQYFTGQVTSWYLTWARTAMKIYDTCAHGAG